MALSFKNKSVVGVIIVVVLLVGYLALNNSGQTNLETIQIGGLISLTGKTASLGERIRNAMELAVEEVNEEYPFTLEIVYEDSGGESDVALSAVRKLIDINRVDIIIGPIRSGPTLAVAPITEARQIILFSPTAGAREISQAGDYVFRNLENPSSHGIGITLFFKQQNVQRVALFTAQAANSISYADAFKESFIGAGGTIAVSVEYNENNTDFRTDIAKATSNTIDAFYLAVASGKDASILVRQIRESGYQGLIASDVAAEMDEFIEGAGIHAEGVILTSTPFDVDSLLTKSYQKKYSDRYDIESDGFSANAYDAVKLVAMAIDSCGNTNTDCVRDYLYQIKNYPGVGGQTTFDKNGDVLKPVIVKVVREGKFVKWSSVTH